jgi:hypothetical protein
MHLNLPTDPPSSVPLDVDSTLQAQIAAAWPDGAGDCELRIDGTIVDPLTDARLDAPPPAGVAVALVRRPAAGAVRPFQKLLKTFDPILHAAFKSLGLFRQNQNTADGAYTGKDSPNNSLTAQSNIVRAYQGVPDVYGYRRIWPDLIQPSVVEYVANVKQITEWLCLSRGKGDVTAVQYAETPIADISGASYMLFEPVPVGGVYEFGATTITDVYEQFASPDVSGQELPYGTVFADIIKSGTFVANNGDTFFTAAFVDGPDLADLKTLVGQVVNVSFTYSLGSFSAAATLLSYVVLSGTATFTFASAVWSGGPFNETVTFTIDITGSNPGATVGPITLPIAATRLWWNLAFLRGLQGSVQIKSEWWQIDGAGVEIGGTRQNQTNTYTAATYDQRFYTEKVTPSAGNGRYKIQFTRLTVQISSDGADVVKLELASAVRHTASKVMPACTIMRIATKATEGSAGLGDRKYNMRWQRHVRTLVAVTPSATRNFARALAHVWHIAGNDIAQLDTDALAAVNAEFGETSALLRFDGSLDDADASLGERMQRIADTARCTIWRDGTQWSVVRDQARTDVDLQLDYRTLAAGGESAMSYSAYLPKSMDGVEVEYVDETTQQTRAYIRLNITTGAVVTGSSSHPMKLKLTGCATTTQAQNRADLEARRLLYQRTTVTDTALAEAQALAPLSLVRWVDPADFGGAEDALQAGEVLALDGLNITTSEALDFQGEPDGRIVFTGADGRVLGSPILCTPATGGGCVLATAAPAGVYVAGTTRQLGSRYAFGPGLSAAELSAAGLYTVVPPLRPTGRNGNVTLTLANYDPRIYEADQI